MAENNRNWDKNQYQQSNDWEQSRNRSNQQNDEYNQDDSRYGNTGYGGNYSQDVNRNYGNGQYGNSANNRERQNEGYGGSYNSSYGSQENRDGGGWNQSYEQPNWQNSEYMSQQYRNDDRRSGQGRQGNYGQQDWNRNDVNYGNNYDRGNRRDMSDYNQGRNQNYGSGYGNAGYSDNYRNSGYNQGMGHSGSNQNYGSRYDNYSQQGHSSHHDRDRNWWDRTKDEVSSWFGSDDNDRNRQQERMNGPHRGKGPKDYRRSEDRIREDVCDRLADDDRVDASHIQVQIQNDEVILSGTVNSREEKRRAEDLVESISGVRNVENRLKVGTMGTADFNRYTGTTDDVSGIGRESGTTNEVIRNTSNEKTKNK